MTALKEDEEISMTDLRLSKKIHVVGKFRWWPVFSG
jgi:hypothetical protein